MEVAANSHRESTAESESNPCDPAALGPTGLIDREEFVRIILQSLYSLGYRRAAETLESESGIGAHSPEFLALLRHALAGRWEECVATIAAVGGPAAEARARASFLVWREHFLELLGSSEGLVPAREVLRCRIDSLGIDRRMVHRLARSMISSEGAVRTESVIEQRLGLLLDLAEVLPPWVSVPVGRLERLVEMAVDKQIASCVYHNVPDEVTLFEDHKCGEEKIPSNCSQILCDHTDEVWFVQFSNNGKFLASSSSDCTAIIWTVEEDDTISRTHCLRGHTKPISLVAWSPNDKMLLTCGNAETLKLWDVDSDTYKLRFTSSTDHIISSCAWFPNSEKIVCGSGEPDKMIFTYDLQGNEIDVWDGDRIPKVSELAVTPDGRFLVSICSNRDIWIHEFPRGKECLICEEHSITSLSLSRDGMWLIVNLNSEEIHLWKVNDESEVPERFKGHKQGKYVIRSCFGGLDCSFIASGSEDSQVYIWHRNHGKPIKVLNGHSSTVNCVSWNPTKPHMLASASDDRTVRIWLADTTPKLNT
ncbi:WD repeat-containing protein 26 [Ananas comosus]|uniref:WD repeat-containing protein 26 n=1 Tax=Ananas comosus TaxID=4615 RepID=A0A199UIA7_ANACO|nr:WD repeat-containing protein 26 [Ananas comosus]OAY64627.1 WD repeat-containing protein 26 [Ananas comosus]